MFLRNYMKTVDEFQGKNRFFFVPVFQKNNFDTIKISVLLKLSIEFLYEFN